MSSSIRLLPFLTPRRIYPNLGVTSNSRQSSASLDPDT